MANIYTDLFYPILKIVEPTVFYRDWKKLSLFVI